MSVSTEQPAAGKATRRDPFNWPSLNRSDLMSLSKVDQHKDIMHTKTVHYREKPRDTSQNLATYDVDGAQCKVWAPETVNKPDSHSVFDVQGAGPRMLHFSLNKPEYNLSTEGIEKSHPCVNEFKSTRKPFNPLDPQYKLQSFTHVQPEAPKFIRDQIAIGDIAGSAPKKPSTKPTRDPISVADIEGTKSRDRTNHRAAGQYQYMDYTDVTKSNWMTKRNPDPLAPTYTVRDNITDGDFLKMSQTGLNANYGSIDHNRPCALPNPISGVRNLNTNDIKGGQHDTKRLGAFTHYQRRAEQIRPVGRNDDVDGSKVGSLKKGITTIRSTNPLMPAYQLPGNSTSGAVGGEVNNPYANQGNKARSSSQAVRKPNTLLKDTGASQLASSSTAQKLDKFIK